MRRISSHSAHKIEDRLGAGMQRRWTVLIKRLAQRVGIARKVNRSQYSTRTAR